MNVWNCCGKSEPGCGAAGLRHYWVPAMRQNHYFWATHSGAELDLVLLRKEKRWGFEFKYADAPGMTKSMKIANRHPHPGGIVKSVAGNGRDGIAGNRMMIWKTHKMRLFCRDAKYCVSAGVWQEK